MVKLLIERGADQLLKDDLYQTTPEASAEYFGQTAVREYLKSAPPPLTNVV